MARTPVNTNLGGVEGPRPMASPRGISAPVASVPESGLMSLAKSLSGIQPSLNQYLEEAKTDYREQESARAYDTIQGMTYDEARSAVQEGTMRDTESPWFRAAFQKQFGMAHAANRRREIITAYNTEFDKQGGNLDEFLARYAQEDFEAFGGSEFIASGIREGMDGVFDTIKNQHAEFTSTQLQSRAADQFYTIANQAVADTVAAGGDVNAAISAVTSEHIAAGLVDEDKADAALIGLAEQYANEGNMEALNAVLNADPYGRGSFTSRGTFATKAQSLMEQGQARRAESSRIALVEPMVALEGRADAGLLTPTDREQIAKWTEDKVYSPDKAQSILERQNVAEAKRLVEASEMNARASVLTAASTAIMEGQGRWVQDTTLTLADGTVKKMPASEIRQTVIDEQMGVLLTPEGPDAAPNVAKAAQVMSSWGLPETYKPWEDAMTGGYQALTASLSAPDKDGKITIQPAAREAYMLYRELEGAPHLRERHIKDATAAAVYRDAETLERIGGRTPEEALLAAASIDRNTSRASLSSRLETDLFEEAVDGYLGEGIANDQVVKTAVEEHTRLLMDLGVSQGKAVEEAIKAFESSYTLVGGTYVNTRDRFVPPELEQAAAAATEEWLSQNPDSVYDEAYLVPDRTQDYWIVADEFGQRLPGGRRFHVNELSSYLSDKTRADVNAEIVGNQ